jgi:DNA-binding NtrC family response regulator
MASMLYGARHNPPISGDSNVSFAPTDRGAAGRPSLVQGLDQVANRLIPDVAMERAREDLAEREYLNLIHWAVRKAPELLRVLRIAYLFGQSSAPSEATATDPQARRSPRASTPDAHSEKLKDIEREHIRRVLRESPSAVEAARRLGINNTTLWRKRKRYNLL